jgi:mannonate dehydratase
VSKKMLENTWRWFGSNDQISLKDIKQTGATGVVTALHQIPVGEVWSVKDIMNRKKIIEAENLSWSVVESLPVHEDIKKRDNNYKQLMTNYKKSLVNLAKCGIDTVCYNFMPILDWSRTDLNARFRDGSITTKFEIKVFAAFDIFLLKRPNAEKDYTKSQIDQAKKFYMRLSNYQKRKLTQSILLGFPGSLESYTPGKLKELIAGYNDISESDLRGNLVSFLKEIIPLAEDLGIFMAIHPDDPPWSLLGLPRIVSNKQDIKSLLSVIDSPSNGLTLCTGSLGASSKNNLVDIAKSFADRVNFIHLRNVKRDDKKNFIEENHLEGDINIYGVMKVLLLEQKKRIDKRKKNSRMPMRPDHGHLMLDDMTKRNFYPGYSLYGRMKGLAELRGLELGITSSLKI